MFVPEETTGVENQKETAQERLEARLNRIEQEVLKENRWWRGGLIAALVMSIFLLPTLYVWIAGDHDVLPATDGEFAEGEHID